MLETILLASSNASGTVYIGPAPTQPNQAYVIPAVQFVWTDMCTDEGMEYKIGTLKLTKQMWKEWWGERTNDLWPWARDFRKFASRLAKKREYWFACPLGCPARIATLEGYETHIREHLAEMTALHEEYLGKSK